MKQNIASCLTRQFYENKNILLKSFLNNFPWFDIEPTTVAYTYRPEQSGAYLILFQ